LLRGQKREKKKKGKEKGGSEDRTAHPVPSFGLAKEGGEKKEGGIGERGSRRKHADAIFVSATRRKKKEEGRGKRKKGKERRFRCRRRMDERHNRGIFFLLTRRKRERKEKKRKEEERKGKREEWKRGSREALEASLPSIDCDRWDEKKGRKKGKRRSDEKGAIPEIRPSRFVREIKREREGTREKKKLVRATTPRSIVLSGEITRIELLTSLERQRETEGEKKIRGEAM